MENNLSVADALALQRSGDGMSNGNGSWIWFILILLFVGGGFWGNGRNASNLNQDFIQRDIFNTNQNVSDSACQTQKEVIESRYTGQLGLQNLGQQLSNCCCETNNSINAVRADAYKNTCDITTAIHAEGEATRSLINAQAMQDLRDRLNDRDRELMTANFQLSQQAQTQGIVDQLRPCPKPAYLTCSPYFAYNQGFGCGGCGNI